MADTLKFVLALAGMESLLLLVNPHWFPVHGAERPEYLARVVRVMDIDTYQVEAKEPGYTGFGEKALIVYHQLTRHLGMDGP